MTALSRPGLLTAWLVVLPLAVLLSACLGRDEKEQENVLPKDYKSHLLETIHGSLTDPTNIREAVITDPMLKPVAGNMRYLVCFRYNPRDGRGQYEGIQTRAVVFFGGRPTQYITPNNEQCGGVNYQPFPELQKLCRTIVCQS